ncbi:MAG: hypothetical protein ACTHKT_13085 [Solirubrobacterales bacterium]
MPGWKGDALARLLFTVAAAFWVAIAFLPATAAGSGSTLSGHAFADLMTSGALSVSAPPWLGLAWYAMPICGGLLLMTLALNEVRGALLRAALTSLATASALTFDAVVSTLDLSRAGTGMWCGLIGSACALSGCGVEITRLARRSDAGVL